MRDPNTGRPYTDVRGTHEGRIDFEGQQRRKIKKVRYEKNKIARADFYRSR